MTISSDGGTVSYAKVITGVALVVMVSIGITMAKKRKGPEGSVGSYVAPAPTS